MKPTQQEMHSDIFEALLKTAKFEQHSDTHYGYRCKMNNYEIDFAMLDGNLDIDCFGFNHKGDWTELEPNDSQINAMKRKLDIAEYEAEHEPLLYVDEYWNNGVSRKDFF